VKRRRTKESFNAANLKAQFDRSLPTIAIEMADLFEQPAPRHREWFQIDSSAIEER
jgi:hypothetical protein